MYQKASELQSLGIMSVMVTVTNVKGSTPRELGAKMVVTETEFFGSIGGGTLEWMALEKARELLKSNEAEKMAVPLCSKAHQCCGGFVELFFDVIKPPPRLFIFGAGHVSQALLEVMAGTQFKCVIVDERPEWIEAAMIKRQLFSNLTLEAHLENPVQWIEKNQASLNPVSAYAIILTHDHGLDEDILEKLAGMNFKYLGLIGSLTKRQRFFDRLEKKGVSRSRLEKVHCPMGIANLGKSPKEVAVSISTQLLQMNFASAEATVEEETPSSFLASPDISQISDLN